MVTRPAPSAAILRTASASLAPPTVISTASGSRPDASVRSRGALLERDADDVELLLQPSDADAEHGSAAGQDVERGDLLRQHHRIALWQDQDAGGQADRRGPRANPCQPDERIGD